MTQNAVLDSLRKMVDWPLPPQPSIIYHNTEDYDRLLSDVTETKQGIKNILEDIVDKLGEVSVMQTAGPALTAVFDLGEAYSLYYYKYECELANIHDQRIVDEERRCELLGKEIQLDMAANDAYLKAYREDLTTYNRDLENTKIIVAQAKVDFAKAQAEAEAAKTAQTIFYIICWPVGAAMDIFKVVDALEVVVHANEAKIKDCESLIKHTQGLIDTCNRQAANAQTLHDEFAKLQLGLPAIHTSLEYTDGLSRQTYNALIEVGKTTRDLLGKAQHCRSSAGYAQEDSQNPMSGEEMCLATMELNNNLLIVPSMAGRVFYNLQTLNSYFNNDAEIRGITSDDFPDGVFDGIINRANRILGFPPLTRDQLFIRRPLGKLKIQA
ncbi:MAG: hypothetical protein Q9213_006707 [Squamulea squamosa]